MKKKTSLKRTTKSASSFLINFFLRILRSLDEFISEKRKNLGTYCIIQSMSYLLKDSEILKNFFDLPEIKNNLIWHNNTILITNATGEFPVIFQN